MNKKKDEFIGYYQCPCNKCLVQPCCIKSCESAFRFMNYIADNMDSFTLDEMIHYANNTPIEFRETINEFIRSNTRYDF